jgi:hypothetical protein
MRFALAVAVVLLAIMFRPLIAAFLSACWVALAWSLFRSPISAVREGTSPKYQVCLAERGMFSTMSRSDNSL